MKSNSRLSPRSQDPSTACVQQSLGLDDYPSKAIRVCNHPTWPYAAIDPETNHEEVEIASSIAIGQVCTYG